MTELKGIHAGGTLGNTPSIEPSEFDNIRSKIASINTNLTEAVNRLDGLIGNLTGEDTPDTAALREATKPQGLLGVLFDAALIADDRVGDVLRRIERLEHIVR